MISGWRHIRGQYGRNLFAYSSLRLDAGFSRLGQCDIGFQIRCAVPGFIATEDTCFSDQFAAFECEFDVTQFDAKTLQFHLLVFAAEKLDITAAVPTAAIAGAVHAFTGSWEKNKAAGGGLLSRQYSRATPTPPI